MNRHIIYDLFKAKVLENPDAPGVLDEQRQLTRFQLDKLADNIAALLPENAERVGIIMNHSVEMIGAILAVLKNGGAYIPIEPSFPQNRIQFMMEDAGADCVILHSQFQDKVRDLPLILIDGERKRKDFPQNGPCVSPRKKEKSNALPDSLAYILYTSGSTGAPKGVGVTNRNVCHYIRAFQKEFHPTDQDRILQYSVCTFDIFVEEVFSALLSGSLLAIPSEKTKEDLTAVMKFVSENHVTILSGFPYLLLEMNRLPRIPRCLRLLISGGDVLRASYINHLLSQADIYNTYGPSETTVCATYFKCNGAVPLEDGTYPIGKAVLGASVEILDSQGKQVKPGEIGEICILGDGVSKGYIGSREKENKNFLSLPDGQRQN